ncbi:MAG: hypothetical protein JWM97_3281 [Phycisphaerales bacterium]|nr:hypothetical protein [Phycisphaerales bacterium]
MEKGAAQGGTDGEFHVLASGTAQGHRIEVVEYGDGSVAVKFDGAVQALYRRSSGNVESCVNTCMTFLRSEAAEL